MFTPPTSSDTANAISSLASEVGRSQLDSQAGQTGERSGREVPPANPTRLPAKAKAKKTSATCGPTSSISSVPEGPLSSWENRLRQRLGATGSTECLLTWQLLDTPAERSLSQLVPSMRPIEGTVCGLWPTPTTRDHKDSAGMSLAPRKDGASRLDLVPRQVFWLLQNDRLPESLFPTTAHMTIGVPRHGSKGMTAKSVGLNPAFPCWLMGYPAAWLLCAPASIPKTRMQRTGTAAQGRSKALATRSFPKLRQK